MLIVYFSCLYNVVYIVRGEEFCYCIAVIVLCGAVRAPVISKINK
jgi:hypothetical protein